MARAGEPGTPGRAVLGAHGVGEPAGAARFTAGPAGKEGPKPREVVLGEQRRGIGPAQERHVGARLLLRRVVLQRTQEGRRMRRVHDDEAREPLGVLRRQVPCQGPAPVVCDEGLDTPTQGVDQRGDVGHQVPGAVGLHIGRLRRTRITAQVRGDAAVAAGEVFEQTVPHEGRFGKPVQEQQHRRVARAGSAARERDAMRQRRVEAIDHG